MTAHRVWIELEQPKNQEDGEKRAALLSAMLKKLGVDRGIYPIVFWAHGSYCFTTADSGTFVEASDKGHWFNLDFLAK